jgi:hypothetical protein
MSAADDNGPLERRSPEGTMSAEVTVPEGYVPYTEPGPFLDRVGPLYERDEIAGWCSAFACLRIIATGAASPMEDCSSRSLTLLLAKLRSGAVILLFHCLRRALRTTSLESPIVVSGSKRRRTSNGVRCEIAFADCYIRSEGRTIGRASGVFKVAHNA